jgi:inner membrane protein
MLQPSTIWMVVATILLVFDLIGADFDGLLPGAVVALVITMVTSMVPLPAWLHGLLFAGLAVVGVMALRGWSGARRSQRPERQGDATAVRAAGSQLARVRLGFDASGEGHVRWRGKVWMAHCLDADAPLEEGEPAEVIGRDGDALLVRRPEAPAAISPGLSRRTSD